MSPTVRARRHAPRANVQKEQPADVVNRPSTGRNTKLGRKVEKPAEPKAGGPSGQTDRARHDKKHANK
jgi:hypothetical protein